MSNDRQTSSSNALSLAQDMARDKAKSAIQTKLLWPLLAKVLPVAGVVLGGIFLIYLLGFGMAILFITGSPEICKTVGTINHCGPPEPCAGGCNPGYLLKRDNYYATDAYALEPTSYRPGYHNGVDFGCSFGEDVLTPIEGRVIAAIKGGADWVTDESGNMKMVYSKSGSGMGYVTIEDKIGLRWRYAHSFETYVRAGQTVQAGQRIAECASTGLSTGAHIHMDLFINNKNKNLDNLNPELSNDVQKANYNWHIFIDWWEKAKNPNSTYNNPLHLDPVVTMAAVWKVDVCPAYTDIYKNRAQKEGENFSSILRCFN